MASGWTDLPNPKKTHAIEVVIAELVKWFEEPCAKWIVQISMFIAIWVNFCGGCSGAPRLVTLLAGSCDFDLLVGNPSMRYRSTGCGRGNRRWVVCMSRSLLLGSGVAHVFVRLCDARPKKAQIFAQFPEQVVV